MGHQGEFAQAPSACVDVEQPLRKQKPPVKRHRVDSAEQPRLLPIRTAHRIKHAS